MDRRRPVIELLSKERGELRQQHACWQEKTIYWRERSSRGRLVRSNFGESSHNAGAEEMPKENNGIAFADRDPSTLFREFAVESIELAQTTPTAEKRALYLKLAGFWHQKAQRWEKKSQPSPKVETSRA